MGTMEVELWVLVDSDGNYSVGSSEDDCNQRFEDEIGTVQGNRRLYSLLLTVPDPKPVTLRATLPAEPAETLTLNVQPV